MRRLGAIRSGLGWSQSELARRAGLNSTTVNQIESGYIGRPYPAQMSKLADALGVRREDAGDLLDEVEPDAL